MYQLINANRDAVIDQLGSLDVPAYLRLCEDLRASVHVTTDADFQSRYRRYWRMNVARLDGEFYRRYFDLLSDSYSRGRADLPTIARELAGFGRNGRQSLQFSFATKLAHIVDPREPVYDSFVAAFYFYSPPSSSVPFKDRLRDLLAFHVFLKNEYERIVNAGLLAPAIHAVRSRWPLGSSIRDERIIDWIIWGWVDLLRDRPHHRGEVLYS